MRDGVEAEGRSEVVSRVSRRTFVRLGAAGAVAVPFTLECVSAESPRRPQAVVDCIQQNAGVELIKSGEPFWAPR